MGRGRAKAKQTKVARALKYYSPETNLSALEQELHGSGQTFPSTRASEPERDVALEGEEDDYLSWEPGRG